MPRAVTSRRLVFSNGDECLAVPWDEEPLHKALFEKAGTTRVYEASFCAAATLFHIHDADHTAYVTVNRSKSPVTVYNEVAVPGGPPPEPVPLTFTKGELFSFCCRDDVMIHRVVSPPDATEGPHFVGVEVHPRPGRSDAAPLLPSQFKIEVEQDTFVMAKLTLQPGESVAPFDAPPTPAVVVVIDGGAGVTGSGPLADVGGRDAGAFAYWDGEPNSQWSVSNGGGGVYEVAVVVWK